MNLKHGGVTMMDNNQNRLSNLPYDEVIDIIWQYKTARDTNNLKQLDQLIHRYPELHSEESICTILERMEKVYLYKVERARQLKSKMTILHIDFKNQNK